MGIGEIIGLIKSLGGGGGGSVPKPLTYDYMPEGYPSKSMQTTVLIEEQQITFGKNQDVYGDFYGAQIEVSFDLVVGKTYVVTWDGSEYECVASPYNIGGYIGNLAMAGLGDDTGEPFFAAAANGLMIFCTPDTNGVHSISFKAGTEVITPIAGEFMPEGYPTKSIQTVQLLPRSTYSFTQDHDLYLGLNIPKAELVAGQTYKVMWDGTEYECISYTDANLVVVGNKHIQDNSADDTGEPFYIGDSGYNNSFAYTNSNADIHEICISKETETITPMAEEFMPVLTSPNGTKYKLTVDDTGTLSATEVT